VATIDHIVPTSSQRRPFLDVMAEEMTVVLERNCREFGIKLYLPDSMEQGIVHVIGPQLGLTQPGMTIACGDSHTSTHGAFGAIAYEYGGTTLDAMSMDERMTICNMSIEGGARAGYVNPDETTFAYLKGRKFAPSGAAWDKAVAWWRSIASDANATYDDRVTLDAPSIEPTVTWGINPGQSVGVTERIPGNADPEALAYMGFDANTPIRGTKIDVAFIGSCPNGRRSLRRDAGRSGTGPRVAKHVKALMVPGSREVAQEAEKRGLHQVFIDAGFEWRGAGCSMCLAMNPDKLEGRQVCASSSNRNFKGRQGSPTGRTLLMSPAMVAAAAIAGEVADVREMLEAVPA
jgi:3-isopropylmalate/(R)-2-methylmalate dehydratase large subunit